jgi:hypothetical protein
VRWAAEPEKIIIIIIIIIILDKKRQLNRKIWCENRRYLKLAI